MSGRSEGAPLADRVALVTGGSRGIGRAACLAFAQAGADVVVHYNSGRTEAAAVVEEIERETGRRALAIGAEVADEQDVERLAAGVAEFGSGRLDILFNNAGVYPTKSFEELTAEEFDRVLAVNVRGPFLCTRAVLPLLRKSAAGRVINVSSNTIDRVPPNVLAYATSKAAVLGLTRALARELGGEGITVNCAIPSLVKTDSADEVFGAAVERTVAAQSIPRRQVPDDFVGLLVFLASDASGFVTGQTINADGGLVFR